ncbi:hypothetical protein KOW79_013106 [Hemibagrus wyckioides]|uniref:Uncharacterized protein n=1 Tax=Hemibagrus wyckioides TaxID=337641 RepID=A0A9D3SLB1_9TELE|nr:hypothetical protein KOW79_013106 [Hemibagrus wyckioides]
MRTSQQLLYKGASREAAWLQNPMMRQIKNFSTMKPEVMKTLIEMKMVDGHFVFITVNLSVYFFSLH